MNKKIKIKNDKQKIKNKNNKKSQILINLGF